MIKKGITNKGLENLCNELTKFKDLEILKINLDNIIIKTIKLLINGLK